MCRSELWIMAFISLLLISLVKSIVMQRFSSLKMTSMIGFLWNTYSMFLMGGKPAKTSIDNKRSYRVIVLISMLGGTILWIAYRSFLAAELAVVIKKYPFRDLETLSKTEFK